MVALVTEWEGEAQKNYCVQSVLMLVSLFYNKGAVFRFSRVKSKIEKKSVLVTDKLDKLLINFVCLKILVLFMLTMYIVHCIVMYSRL